MLERRFQKEDYVVTVVKAGDSGIDMAIVGAFDIVILDLTLSHYSGADECRKLRQLGSQLPILMLSARRRTMDKVIGLQSGADDYLTKPFKVVELLARIDALIRRARRAKISRNIPYKCGGLDINGQRAEIRCGGRKVFLSPLEYHLLRYFLEHRQVTVSRHELAREVWGSEAALQTRTVDVHVAWLRQKIEKNPHKPKCILTVNGFGYKFVG